jgi:hypothetical protein
MDSQHRSDYRTALVPQATRRAFRQGQEQYSLQANEAIHLMPAAEGLPDLQLETVAQARKFFLQNSEFGQGKKDRHDKQRLSGAHFAVG